MKIDTFRGDYFFLSNFYEATVTYKGLTYGTSEAAYQAQKCMAEEEKAEFCAISPKAAKEKGHLMQQRPDWDCVKVGVMEEIVRCKFAQNEDLKAMLLGTGDAILEEGNTWGDTFWGVVTSGHGQNHLGKILMKIRSELAAEDQRNRC